MEMRGPARDDRRQWPQPWAMSMMHANVNIDPADMGVPDISSAFPQDHAQYTQPGLPQVPRMTYPSILRSPVQNQRYPDQRLNTPMASTSAAYPQSLAPWWGARYENSGGRGAPTHPPDYQQHLSEQPIQSTCLAEEYDQERNEVDNNDHHMQGSKERCARFLLCGRNLWLTLLLLTLVGALVCLLVLDDMSSQGEEEYPSQLFPPPPQVPVLPPPLSNSPTARASNPTPVVNVGECGDSLFEGCTWEDGCSEGPLKFRYSSSLTCGHEHRHLCCPPEVVCAHPDWLSPLQGVWCNAMGSFGPKADKSVPPLNLYFVPPTQEGDGSQVSTTANHQRPDWYGTKCTSRDSLWYFDSEAWGWLGQGFEFFNQAIGGLCSSSRCVLSEHFSCVLPNDERFPCPLNLPSSISFENVGAAVYGTNGKCKLSRCAEGYHFNNVLTGCDKDTYIPEDDGAPVHLLNGVCSTSHWVRINAQYRTRFAVGDTVSIVTPGGVPSFDPATVSAISDIQWNHDPPSVAVSFPGGELTQSSLANAEPRYQDLHRCYTDGASILLEKTTVQPVAHVCVAETPPPCGSDHCNPTGVATYECSPRAGVNTVMFDGLCSRNEECVGHDQIPTKLTETPVRCLKINGEQTCRCDSIDVYDSILGLCVAGDW